MRLIREQILKEKMKSYPNKKLIQRLQILLDQGGLSFEDFCRSGRYEDKQSFQYVNKNLNLHNDCTDVVTYCGGYYIQLLINRRYMYNDFQDISLDKVEEYLWNSEADAELNNK